MSTLDPTGLGAEFITNPRPAIRVILDAAKVDIDALEVNALAIENGKVLDTELAANTETLLATGSTDPLLAHTALDSTSGIQTITVAAPGAGRVGTFKVIEMTVDGGDATIVLTNVIGQPAGTTFTLDTVGDAILLYAVNATTYLWVAGNPTIV